MNILKQKTPNVLVILDGFGIAKPSNRNAVYVANPVNFNNYFQNYPHTKLVNWGENVGLPKGEMGNSEVGHMTIGAGKIVKQHSLLISDEIITGKFFRNSNLNNIISDFSGETVHIAGLLSNAQVHSSVKHLIATYQFLSNKNIKTKIHLFSDGRDSGTNNFLEFYNKLPLEIRRSVVTISGRYYAMDRDMHWERTKLAYDVMVKGNGNHFETVEKAIEDSYHHKTTDEFIKPCVIADYKGCNSKDMFFIFNFREDRIRQIGKAINSKSFKYFNREMTTIQLSTLTQYEEQGLESVPFVYPKIKIKDTLSDKLSNKGLSQLHIAESEKYAHVTYFFNGGREVKNKGEEFIIVPSPRVASFDLCPEMSALEVGNEVIENLGKYNFYVVNFANPDMVAHTGDIEATSFAVKTVDIQLARIVNKVESLKGQVYITSDHGNAEVLRHSHQKDIDTKHNRNPVPFIYIGDKKNTGITKMESLSDIAGFILKTIKI
jgi:2,3-bisphosphoglycerate-independent phosphoglycerate mutase